MRYFLVSYLSGQGYGSIWFEHKHFPNYQWLCLKVNEGTSNEGVIILNIFEFSNKSDFDAFKEETN